MAKRMTYRTLMKKVDDGDIEIERWNSETEQDGSIYAQVFHNDMSNAGRGNREEILVTKAPSDVTGRKASMDNKRVAGELIRLAKSLVGSAAKLEKKYTTMLDSSVALDWVLKFDKNVFQFDVIEREINELKNVVKKDIAQIKKMGVKLKAGLYGVQVASMSGIIVATEGVSFGIMGLDIYDVIEEIEALGFSSK